MSEDPADSESNPFGSGSSASFPNTKEKINRIGSVTSNKCNKLPRDVKTCLDGFSEKMMKTKSFHQKLSTSRLVS